MKLILDVQMLYDGQIQWQQVSQHSDENELRKKALASEIEFEISQEYFTSYVNMHESKRENKETGDYCISSSNIHTPRTRLWMIREVSQ